MSYLVKSIVEHVQEVRLLYDKKLESDKQAIEIEKNITIESIKSKYSKIKTASTSFGTLAIGILVILFGLAITNDFCKFLIYVTKRKAKNHVKVIHVKPKQSRQLKKKVNKKKKNKKNKQSFD